MKKWLQKLIKIKTTSQFERDLKVYIRKHVNLDDLKIVVNCLTENRIIPAKFRPHPLKGDMSGFMECHIKKDILLLYITDTSVVTLVRLASHDKLFKNR